MPEIHPTTSLEQSEQLVSKVERTPEDIAKGREKIEGQLKKCKVLYETHIEQELIEREGLEVAMEKAFTELDNSPVGKWYKETTGIELSEAKQTSWGTIGANTLEGGQSLANIIIHPMDTAKAVGQFIWSPIDSTKQVMDAYSKEWKYSNTAGKVGLVWRGSFEVVFGAKGATTISKTAKVGYKSGKVGKLGAGVQKAIGGLEGGVVSNIPKALITASGAVATGANKIAEKIPEGLKTFTKEQSQIRAIDNPLDRKISALDETTSKTQTKAAVAGEIGVVGETTVFGEKLIIPKSLTKAEKISARPENIKEIDWNELVTDFPELKPNQLQKVPDMKDFFENNNLTRKEAKEFINSAQFDSIRLGNLNNAIVVYRYYGGKSGEKSSWVSRDWVETPKDRKEIFSLPPSNHATEYKKYVIPKGSAIIESKIGKCFGKDCSEANQVYVLDLKNLTNY